MQLTNVVMVSGHLLPGSLIMVKKNALVFILSVNYGISDFI